MGTPSRALEKELARKTREAKVLRQVSSRINATLDLDEIFGIVLHTMDELFGFDHSLILLLDETGKTLTVVASRGYEDSGIGAQVAVGVGVIGQVAKKRRMMRVSNLSRQRAYASAIRKQMEKEGRSRELGDVVKLPGLENAECQIAIPLMIEGSLIGVFVVESVATEPFGEADEILVSIVANQAASALNNARLYRAESERRRELAEAHEHLRRLNETLEDRVQERTAELQQALLELKAAQASLVQSAKMAALGGLVAGVSHEINTPIGAIHSTQDTLVRAVKRLARGLEAQDQVDPKLARTLSSITSSCQVIRLGTERITSIVGRLRSFARLDEAEQKTIDIHECIEDTLVLLGHELKQRIRLVRNYGEVEPIPCYPGRLNQVLLNLLLNALQAIDGEGEIAITTYQRGQEVAVEIADSGVGIPPDVLQRVFDPGFTTKGVGVGTGLGLSICFQIMQDHRGRIEASSEPGRGATFRIALPITTVNP